MAKTKRRTYQTVIQALCLMLDGAYMLLAVELIEMCFRQKKFGMEDIGAVAVITVHSLIVAAMDIAIFRWCDKGKRSAVASGFLMKLGVFCMAFGTLYIMWKIPQAAVCFWAIGAVILLCGVMLFRWKNNMKSAFSGGTAGFGFIGDSAAGYFPMAEREYFKLNGIASDSKPREGQHTQIMRFAAMPIVYFMVWLAEKGGYSEHFIVDEGNGELVENVKNRTADPLELLLSQPNKQLNAADLNDEMLDFASFYYDCRISNNSQGYEKRGWFSDFFTDADLHGEPIFCSEFSWARYERLKKQLDSEFDEYKKEAEMICLWNEFEPMPNFYWQKFDANVAIFAGEGVSAEYVKRCVDEICNSEKLARLAADTAVFGEPPKPRDLCIYTPYGDETAYVIEGEDKRVAVRGGEIIYFSELDDQEMSPWTRRADLKYRTIRQLSGIDPDEIDTPEKALAAGLVAVEQLPARYGGDPNSPENIMYLPPCIAGFKLKCDEVVAAAVCYGAADRYFCGPFIMGEGIVPKTFYVSANLGPQRIFHQRIDVYSGRDVHKMSTVQTTEDVRRSDI